MASKVKYGNIEIKLSKETDLNALRAEVAEALAGRRASPWVLVQADNGSTHSLLISPGTPLVIADYSLRTKEQRATEV